MLKSTETPLSARTDIMASDPITLFDRLMAVKPDGLSMNAWATGAQVNRSIFADIKKRDAAHPDTVDKLLDFIGLTKAEFHAGVKQEQKEAPSAVVRAPRLAFRGDDRPRDIPIVGTAECADIDFEADGGVSIPVETLELDMADVVDYARRPVSLDNRRDVYAIYFRGHSMAPRYEPGEIGYVDPMRPARPRDYVIVQLRRGEGEDADRTVVAMAKRLVKQSASFIELEQFNPAATFRIDRKRVAHIHRIIPWDELVAF
ncbi:S24 family peptidase [Sphingomonas sp. S2-65]|uniref:S24 family peptidase n=1 Tax=Sphingomonas sp. S2-65 TaxID=2903960 RepID=UPI001F36674D|nr:S24 family peptidase [Sphingomonas sp. S2-65]UYY60130.1 hypothetical protein LZ586_08650 [Sphingomonas sp. S2-65]